MKGLVRKTGAIVLAMLMIISTLPGMAFADSTVKTVGPGGDYESIALAFAANQYNIKLIGDITENVSIGSGKTVTIDLNGFVLKCEGSNTNVINNKGSLTISDGDKTKVHNFKVGSDGLWTLTTDAKTVDLESLTSRPETGEVVAVKGGCISGGNGNIAGGGVYNDKNSTLTMLGGTIAGCSAKYPGGGVYNDQGSNLILSGGSIVGCIAMGPAGGVYNKAGSALSMSEGSNISYCASHALCGGVYNDTGSTLTMSGGSIVGCAALQGNGGGVYNGGTFYMYGDAEIAECTSSGGSGAIENMGTFTMYGNASITNCKSINSNGGAMCTGGGTFKMYGKASITNCTCPKDGCVVVGTTFSPIIGGSAKITDNTKTTGDSAIEANLILLEGAKISIGTDEEGSVPVPEKGMQIGVTILKADSPGHIVSTTGVVTNANSADYHKYFVADDPTLVSYNDKTSDTNQVVKLKVAHIHDWTYSLKAGTTDTIEADCVGTIDVCEYEGTDTSLTISAEDVTEDGKTHGATLSGKTLAGVAEKDFPVIQYEKETSESKYDKATTEAPKEAGKYRASITVGEGETAVTAYVKYEIKEKKKVQVIFDANGGTGSMDNLTVKEDDTIKLPENSFKAPDGKKFKCWSIDGKTYDAGSEVKVTKDITVKAEWEANVVTADFASFWVYLMIAGFALASIGFAALKLTKRSGR